MPKIEVSFGELLDKYSILIIKLKCLEFESQKEQVRKEMIEYEVIVEEILTDNLVRREYNRLLDVNLHIWNGMEDVFADTDPSVFGELSRRITELNKERSYLKRNINNLTSSKIREEKSYFLDTESENSPQRPITE